MASETALAQPTDVNARQWSAGSFLGRLTDRVREAFLQLGRGFVYQPGGVMMRQGDSTDYVLAILDGVVKLTGAASNGREVLLGIRVSGDLIGETEVLNSQRRMVTATAAGQVLVRLIRPPEFHRFLGQSQEAAFALSNALADRLRDATRNRIDFAAFTAEARTARLIYELAVSYGHEMADGRLLVDVPLTQAELASLAGLSVVAMERVLRRLRDLGIIETGYRALTVSDVAGLRAMAET
jgi:CRP/FNR family transcriptional regulator, cyclic AMP receptor protein